MPWGSGSDFDTYEGFRCSKKVDKHYFIGSSSVKTVVNRYIHADYQNTH